MSNGLTRLRRYASSELDNVNALFEATLSDVEHLRIYLYYAFTHITFLPDHRPRPIPSPKVFCSVIPLPLYPFTHLIKSSICSVFLRSSIYPTPPTTSLDPAIW